MKTTLAQLLAAASFFLLQQPLQALTINITEIFAYPDCRTGVRLEAEDTDSHPTNLIYTLLASPTTGGFFVAALRDETATASASMLKCIPAEAWSEEPPQRHTIRMARTRPAPAPCHPYEVSRSLSDKRKRFPLTFLNKSGRTRELISTSKQNRNNHHMDRFYETKPFPKHYMQVFSIYTKMYISYFNIINFDSDPNTQ